MADKSQPTDAPHSTTSPPNPPYTPRATSIPDDSETEFNPTPLHSPGGPQYEDLPPSYDFALSDARNGAAALDASQIEAHRVSANEGPDEPEVWEYRMRDEGAAPEDVNEHEDAPAYEGHVPIQHVASSENIPVGRVGGFNAAPAAASRGVADAGDPPRSIPHASSNPEQGFFRGRGGHRGQAWSPFGTPGHGPFGAPGNGPFGAPGVGPFGRQMGQRNGGGRIDRGRGGRGGRSVPSQDWSVFGRNLGKMGEDFGRRMGNWGEQFGRQAGAAGEQFGRQAGAMGQQLGRDSAAWAAAYSGGAAGAQNTHAAGPSDGARSEPPQYDEPPSYQGPAGVAGQDTGVCHGDRKVNLYPQEKEAEASFKQPLEKPSEKTLGKQKADDYDDDDDDDSSISSDSSTSSSSSDSEDGDYDDAQAAYLKRIESIHRAAEVASSKGKKSAEEIAHERDLAMAAATREKEATELRIAQKQSRQTQKRELRSRKRELARAYRQKKTDLRTASEGSGEGKGKGRAKAKKGREWREVKREYKVKRRALKRERVDAKREWKREKRERKMGRKEGPGGGEGELKELKEKS